MEPSKPPEQTPAEPCAPKAAREAAPTASLASVRIRRRRAVEPRPMSRPPARGHDAPIEARIQAQDPPRHAADDIGADDIGADGIGDEGSARPAASADLAACRPEDIVQYWSQLRRGRRFPSRAELDSGRIALSWPNAILLRCRSNDQALEAAAVFRGPGDDSQGIPASGRPSTIDFAPMVVEWILSLAGEALRAGAPVKDREVFTLANGKLRYDAYALPLGEEAGGVDHVLCYVHQDQ